MVKCKCGGELLWLYFNKGPGLIIDPDRFVPTDYAYCDDCEAVYKRFIHTDVEWTELRPSCQKVRNNE